MYDVVIVGAGLAGLATACSLKSKKVLLLEKERTAGGRVCSGLDRGTPYDLGALFASPLPLHLFDNLPPLVKKAHNTFPYVGLNVGGAWFHGLSPYECLGGRKSDSMERVDPLASFFRGKGSYDDLDADTASAVSAFFGLIHPSPIKDSLPDRQRDALRNHSIDFYMQGSSAVVESLLRGGGHQVVYAAHVQGLVEHSGWVDVNYLLDGAYKTVRARSVIVSTPPSIALSLLAGYRISEFLRKVEFSPGLSLVFRVEEESLKRFSYFVATDLPFNTVVRCDRGGDPFVHIYCIGNKIGLFDGLEGEAVRNIVARSLFDIGVLADEGGIRLVARKLWKELGPHINFESYGAQGISVRVSRRLFLAGDYTWFNDAEKMPYGMSAAVNSGVRAADSVDCFLSGSIF